MATATANPRIAFTAAQKKLLLALALAVGLRMLGLFLVLPVFTLYGLQFTPSRFLVGFAFGCYGLAMACFEIPLGRLSDRIGRRKVLLIGMSVFALGSFLCAAPAWFPASYRITELILARFVQGIGTITSTAFATVADNIPSERRSTAMAIIGIPIGASFILGVIGGPFLAGLAGARFLFVLTGLLGVGSVLLLARFLPYMAPHPSPPLRLGEVIRLPAVLALDLSAFFMNTFMTSFWFFFPLIVTGQHHLKMTRYYEVLLPMLLISGVTMFGFSRGADHGWGRGLAALCFFVLAVSAVLLFSPSAAGLDPKTLAAVLVPGTLFLVGFTGLEPVLPSLVSKAAPDTSYGTALGSFQTLQFLGSFAGGAVAGGLSHLPPAYIMVTLMATSFAGCALMLFGRRPH
ncbi:MAG TPA: MFS transporter [Terriglobia bacterium]|nr:MFS transporter [Terriglobia bacterium]